ncbi:MAG TPA: DUF5362 family protein, partial [Chitinophagaceae bacterium]|nr:DUF5362 family protein [Chitinophagaceae bacterium]
MEQQSGNLFELQVDASSMNYLSETAKWGKFLSIVGFIGCALLVILGLYIATATGGSDALGGLYSMGLGLGLAIVYIVLALLYFFPCLYLFRFSNAMQVALRSNDQNNLVAAFSNLKSCFKFVGILTIVILAFYALGIIFAVIGASMSG